jgi:gamma-glutamylcysteine synthetase
MTWQRDRAIGGATLRGETAPAFVADLVVESFERRELRNAIDKLRSAEQCAGAEVQVVARAGFVIKNDGAEFRRRRIEASDDAIAAA